MRHGSLFSGIGGFDLAAEWMGWENVFHCEWNEFGQRVLKYHFPKSISYNDITKTDFTIHRGQIDIITGGFPCQPYSTAGKRLGKADDRHLWPEMLRAIREIQPTWVVGENVRGLTNWNGGVVFDEVQADLEAEGYEVTPFLLPACSVNAPHRRDRIWFVAYSGINGGQVERGCLGGKAKKAEKQRQYSFYSWSKYNGKKRGVTESDLRAGLTTNTDRNGQHKRNGENEKHSGKRGEYALNDVEPLSFGHTEPKGLEGKDQPGSEETRIREHIWGNPARHGGQDYWRNFPTQPPVCGGDDGFPRELDGITFSKWRSESIKAYGNAIVPQVALQIFKAISQYENN